ncbi:hypothetical protein PACTADRAFT_42130 [Pachysolen tannophilus NRRL Y-2460]|uniref:CSC1/OSCA1-like 7TM region domain-containing protein n=1 Tax=Pachysolen tannophilus NRRL Y-2460 TaxID=669874 RepID=A0A1E4TU57_PACTA|nr:hypothetical protein PACTADRAFT_42130 [Pachysolen tannophilus NRRL Y-2460]
MDDDPIPGFDPRAQTQRVFQVQVVICTVTGILIFFCFCILRYKIPQIYAIRSFRKRDSIKPLPDNYFGWIRVLNNITDDEILEKAGLDAFVFLNFFKLCIKILTTCGLFAMFIISPLRFYYTGEYDKDNISWSKMIISSFIVDDGDGDQDPNRDSNEHYLWVYPFFTITFTLLVCYFVNQQTSFVITTRQKYLGSQNSITDRTIKVSHIPPHLNDEEALKEHIERLVAGKVGKVHMVHDYSSLKELFEERKLIINQLESTYSRFYGLNVKIFEKNVVPSAIPFKKLSLFGDKIDILTYLAEKLMKIDDSINELRSNNDFKSLNSAFVTMDSVSTAQMCAQAIFSPNVMELITVLAPSPQDINWENFTLSPKAKIFRRNFIQILIFITSALLIIPLSYIAKLLNVKTIRKLWPEFGDYLIANKWFSTIINGFLPTYLFTLINVALPYVISYLTELQGIISKGDIELSVIRKNFLYIFFNLFLVFTLFGTWSNYWALLSDTTKIAYLLASSIKTLSLFYVDLILLQGLTMFPFKLLQIDELFLITWKYLIRRKHQTPREYRDLIYKPSIFDFGLILPQHILIFIITLIYSVISTKIVVSGLIYFVAGFYTYKYQLIYSMIHLRHSTGKSWPIIVRRICLGLILLQITMFGTLLLEEAYILAAPIVPLFFLTIALAFFFEKHYSPLLNYIALQSIEESGYDDNDIGNNIGNSGNSHNNNFLAQDYTFDEADNFDSTIDNAVVPDSAECSPLSSNEDLGAVIPHSSMTSLKKRRSTIEEERESHQQYVYPYLIDTMDGPWIGFNGDYVSMICYYYKHSNGNLSEYGSANIDNQATIVERIFRRKNTKADYD